MSQLLVLDTLLTADSVEWCATPGLKDILGCGTYQLNKHDNTRLGSLMLFSWDGNKKNTNGKALLAAATSNGTVHYLQLQRAENELVLSDLGEVNLVTEDLHPDGLHLSLSLDWGKSTNRVAVSDSLGQIGLVELCEAAPRISRLWKAHEYEAWIVCFGSPSSGERMVYSGGDDSKLCAWDTRMDASSPCFTSKWHSMGVCSLQIHSNSDHETILGSGSYDENFVLWDTRNMSRPLKEKSLGGGIWRIKWNPSFPNFVAAACMHNHFHVLNVHLDSQEPIEIVDVYKEHASLAYGVDWCKKYVTSTEGDEEVHVFTLASCSFYDHSMHLWTTPVK